MLVICRACSERLIVVTGVHTGGWEEVHLMAAGKWDQKGATVIPRPQRGEWVSTRAVRRCVWSLGYSDSWLVTTVRMM